jgi:hypothetical protein
VKFSSSKVPRCSAHGAWYHVSQRWHAIHGWMSSCDFSIISQTGHATELVLTAFNLFALDFDDVRILLFTAWRVFFPSGLWVDVFLDSLILGGQLFLEWAGSQRQILQYSLKVQARAELYNPTLLPCPIQDILSYWMGQSTIPAYKKNNVSLLKSKYQVITLRHICTCHIRLFYLRKTVYSTDSLQMYRYLTCPIQYDSVFHQ